MDKLSELVARSEIQNALCHYARGVDRRDWDAVRACFHEDAEDEHGEFTGTVDEFITWVSARHMHIPFAAHFLGNCLIEFVDDRTALVETYFVAMQRRTAAARANAGNGGSAIDELDAEVIGRYLDRFERRDSAWKIAQRRVVYDSSRLTTSTHKPRAAKGILGTRTPLDPAFNWFSRAERISDTTE